MAIKRLSSRYFDDENHRVFPYDSFECLTEAPLPGKRGDRLLYSLNSSIVGSNGNVRKWAWCWVCDEFVEASRRTSHQVMLDYLRRTNVNIRAEGGQRQRELALAQRLEERAKR